MVVPDPQRQRTARRTLLGVVAALFAAMLIYKILKVGHLEQTALFYLGIPALIALTVVATVRPRSTLGTIMATITVGLALAGPLLAEGIVCLIIAAPLFYLSVLSWACSPIVPVGRACGRCWSSRCCSASRAR
jgi:hypothetical protein